MKTEPDHIPDEVFDHLGTHDFNSLSPEQQTKVLQHFTLEEYDELHEAMREIKNIVPSVPVRNPLKEQLLEEFDRHHSRKSVVKKLWEPRLILRIAAAIMLFMTGWLGYSLFHPDPLIPAEILAMTDTVYVTKEVPATPEKIHDTVYIIKVKQVPAEEKETIAQVAPLVNDGGPYDDHLNVISLKDLDGALNAFKRNSLKYDSLIRIFSFIGL